MAEASEHPPVGGGSQGPQEQGLELPTGMSLRVLGPGELGFNFLSQNESGKSLYCATLKSHIPSEVTTGLDRAERLGLL
jgi:hypothetical protein